MYIIIELCVLALYILLHVPSQYIYMYACTNHMTIVSMHVHVHRWMYMYVILTLHAQFSEIAVYT